MLFFTIVSQGEVKLVERLGKFDRKLESGFHFLIPIIENISGTVSTKEQVFDTKPMPMITKDNVSITVDAIIFFKIFDAIKYKYNIDNAKLGIENITATTLRNLVGELELDTTLTSRETVNTKLQAVLDEATDKWGVTITRVEIKNIKPPADIQNAMDKQMIAERTRREAILTAEGEKRSRILRAEGEQQSAVLTATAKREADVLEAQGKAEAMLKIAEAEAKQIELIAKANAESERLKIAAWKESGLSEEQIVQLKAIEGLAKASEGEANKLIIPTEALSSLSGLNAAKHVFNDK